MLKGKKKKKEKRKEKKKPILLYFEITCFSRGGRATLLFPL
jgi:hypothetical protein